MSVNVCVCEQDAASQPHAQALAQQLQLQYSTAFPSTGVVLVVEGERIYLQRMDEPPVIWEIDFSASHYQARFNARSCKTDPLSRALGLAKNKNLKILDMSAGLGKDALWLAHCGAQVTLLERHPVLAFLLEQAVEKLRINNPALGMRMNVIQADAAEFLKQLEPGQFDAAYYDPMFLPRQKSALVKKDMQILQALLGHQPASDLLEIALPKIPRLIVKRAKLDPPYHGHLHTIMPAGVVRFEIYRGYDK